MKIPVASDGESSPSWERNLFENGRAHPAASCGECARQACSPMFFRQYGLEPCDTVVLHGGPGAPGSAAPVARGLGQDFGVLEPFQAADSIQGQVRELHDLLNTRAPRPVSLIGWSWGAMLGFIYAARHPAMVKRLVLVSSGPFEEQFATGIMETRLKRLSREEQKTVRILAETLNDRSAPDREKALAQFGTILGKADAYDPLPVDHEPVTVDPHVFSNVWAEAQALRASGRLVLLGREITCPVTAIHGDYDPHPSEGITLPLATVLKQFNFFILRDCGHQPWIEARAREKFWRVLRNTLSS